MVTWGANYDYPSVFLVLHLVCSLHYQRKCRWWWWQKNHLDPLWWGWGLSWMHLSSGRTASFLGLFSNHLHTCLPPPPKTIFWGWTQCLKITPNIAFTKIFKSVMILRGAKRRGIKALIQVPKTFMDELHLWTLLFQPILSGNSVWPQALGSKKDHFVALLMNFWLLKL